MRSNLRAIAREVRWRPPSVALSRERAKAPYTEAEIAANISLDDAACAARARTRPSQRGPHPTRSRGSPDSTNAALRRCGASAISLQALD